MGYVAVSHLLTGAKPLRDIRLKVTPCFVFFFAVPIFGEGAFAKQGRLSCSRLGAGKGLFLQSGHKNALASAEWQRLQKLNLTVLPDDGFGCFGHGG